MALLATAGLLWLRLDFLRDENRVEGLDFKGLGFRVQGLGFRV